MLTFILKRLLQSIVVMLTVALIAFSLFRYVGDPINNMVGQDTTLEERAELRERLGLNDPFFLQFYRFAADASVGEFGFSYQHRRPVKELIAERLPRNTGISIGFSYFSLSHRYSYGGLYCSATKWLFIPHIHDYFTNRRISTYLSDRYPPYFVIWRHTEMVTHFWSG